MFYAFFKRIWPDHRISHIYGSKTPDNRQMASFGA